MNSQPPQLAQQWLHLRRVLAAGSTNQYWTTKIGTQSHTALFKVGEVAKCRQAWENLRRCLLPSSAQA